MTGDVRNLDLTSASAAALNRAALRLKRTTRRLWAGAQVRLNLAAAAPRSSLVGASVIPTVRYRDVPKAVDWLCRAFGMRVHRTVTDADGAPRYAELTVGAGMLMVAPIEDTPFGRMMVQPDEIGGVETQVCYLCVGDARAHAARARAAGAVVIIEPDDEANKGRGYSCRDPEGHVWNFGVYDPWGKPPSPPAPVPGLGLGRTQQALIALALLAVAGTVISQLLPQPNASAAVTAAKALAAPAEGAPQAVAKAAAATIAPVSAKAADAPAGDRTPAAEDAPADRAELEAAEKAAATARAQLASTRGALAKVEREATAARAELEELQRAKLAAERSASEARAKLAALQKTAERARAEAALERARRLASVRAALKARKSVYTGRPRGGTWCYSPTGQVVATKGGGRLNGFCKS
jgi:uncharacterized glyoxalase superfamily protein PhnB